MRSGGYTTDWLGGVAITGIGLALPIGLQADEIVTRMRCARPGIGPLTRFRFEGASAAEAPPFELRGMLRKPKNEKLMSHAVRLAMYAAARAVEHSRIDFSAMDRGRVAVHTGSGHTGICFDDYLPALSVAWAGGVERDLSYLGGRAAKLVDAYFSIRTLSNCGIGMLAAEHDLHGPGCNFAHSEPASAWALAAAAADLMEDRCDAALVGGYDSLVSKPPILAYLESGLLSPTGRQAAFAAGRDGVVLGEGAAFFILERAEDALARGAEPLAFLDAAVNVCHTSGEALFEDGLPLLGPSLGELFAETGTADVVVARGIGTPEMDQSEAEMLAELGSESRIAAFKALTGYLGAATAAAEIALSILALRNHFLPAALVGADADPAVPLRLSTTAAALAPAGRTVVSLSANWSGQASAMSFRVPAPAAGPGSPLHEPA